jgi:hypothetical protein
MRSGSFELKKSALSVIDSLYNNYFKNTELLVSRKDSCKAFTGTKMRRKIISNSGQKNVHFPFLPKNLLAESKMPVGLEGWRDSQCNQPIPCLASQIQDFPCPQGQWIASLHRPCIHH